MLTAVGRSWLVPSSWGWPSPVVTRARGDDAATAASTEPAESSPAGPTNTYVVAAGDTLSGIAAGHGLSLSELVDANEWTDGSDHAIFPGDVIALPDDAVAVPTTRSPSNNNDDSDDEHSTPAASATSGGYAATSLPSLDGVILKDHRAAGRRNVLDPCADGEWRRLDDHVRAAALPGTRNGTVQDSCLDFVDFEDSTVTVSMRVGTGTVSVLVRRRHLRTAAVPDHLGGAGSTAGGRAARG